MPESHKKLSDGELGHWARCPGRFTGVGMSQKTCLYLYVYAATEYGTGVRAQGLPALTVMSLLHSFQDFPATWGILCIR